MSKKKKKRHGRNRRVIMIEVKVETKVMEREISRHLDVSTCGFKNALD